MTLYEKEPKLTSGILNRLQIKVDNMQPFEQHAMNITMLWSSMRHK